MPARLDRPSPSGGKQRLLCWKISPLRRRPALDLRRLIAAFDGNRHIRIALIGEDGDPVAQSSLASADRAPKWFVRLIGVPPEIERIELPRSAAPIRALRLETDSRNEVSEVWNALRETAALIAMLALSSGLLIWWAITRVLRPLATLSAALRSVRRRRIRGAPAAGALPETQVIATAFNRMAQDLSAARERNQLSTVNCSRPRRPSARISHVTCTMISGRCCWPSASTPQPPKA
ncbi:MAG: LapD/MoxY N-terminal periplasmic domain-containing protein [Aliidongia sp.]